MTDKYGAIEIIWEDGHSTVLSVGDTIRGARAKGRRPYKYRLYLYEDASIEQEDWRRIAKWLNTEVASAIDWNEKRLEWIREKPNKPCVFIACIKYPDTNPRSYYQLFKLNTFKDSEGSYLALTDMDGHEEMPLEDLHADEYLILEEL